ncbi:putative basic amino acid antiporter YfcC [Clostridium sp. D2Q-11]|uniref:Basic amino acid antiporter YfcC n=1 Tax=Anaeromonas frigoriresistens TaxID=2683708 RepID=A0A942V078_9FIRM|nr:putative basic amino acid antiporter YfcC [Anaeromonas frigoriresistens]MBS4537677.1 putative basic amino acid antiporter YfcC [Anaeromonas frigoriresistens]
MSTKSKEFNKPRAWQMPDTYVIIFCVVLVAALLTYLIPVGSFDVNYKVVNTDNRAIEVDGDGNFEAGGKNFAIQGNEVFDSGGEVLLTVEDEAVEYRDENDNLMFIAMKEYGDYQPALNEDGEKIKEGIPLFKGGGELGVLNYVFEGLVSGSKWGSAVGVVAFILIIGGAFGIILRTGAIEAGLLKMIDKTKGMEIAIIPVIFILFAVGGAVFGMGEEAIAFAMIIVPLVIGLGYDAITGIMITYVATQIGFATSWMNPFSVQIAQGVAGVRVGSGMGFRVFMFIFFTTMGVLYTLWYARRIKKDPTRSISYHSDAYFRDDFKENAALNVKFGIGHILVLLTILAGIVWLVWGVMAHAWYIPEIASQFFVMGLVAGIIGVIFKLDGMRINDIASSFRNGAKDLLGAALVVGMAKGIVLVLGGAAATEASVLNTILNGMGNAIDGLGTAASAWVMFLFQSVFNFFVVSGSGQAALTMPLMAPLAELVGVTKQVAVLAFQLGDGFTNLIVPTSASLMGVLGVARLDWSKWAKFQIKFQGVLFVFGSVFVIIAVLMGYR